MAACIFLCKKRGLNIWDCNHFDGGEELWRAAGGTGNLPFAFREVCITFSAFPPVLQRSAAWALSDEQVLVTEVHREVTPAPATHAIHVSGGLWFKRLTCSTV